MNLLAIQLFVGKYFDYVFLTLVALFSGALVLFVRKIVPSEMYKKTASFLKSKFGTTLLLVAILLGGFLVRLYKIDNPIADWHSFRQADTASVTRVYVEEGINVLYPRYHDISTTQSGLFNPNGYRFVELPVFNVAHALLSNSFPVLSLEIWGRLLSIASALITAYLLYLIGRKFLGSCGGLLGAFFYLFIPFNIYFTRVILPEPMATMFSVWALWAFIKYIDKQKAKYLIFTIISFSLALLIKPYSAFYGVAVLYLVIRKWGVKGILKPQLLLSGVAVALPFLSWRLWISQYPEGIPFWKWTFNGDGIRFRPAFWFWIFGERIGKLILGIWGLLPFAMGIISHKKSKELIHYLGLGMFFYIAVIATANVRHDYYQTLIIPSVSLLLALGTLTLWNMTGFNKVIVRVVTSASLSFAFLIGFFQVKEFYKINRPEIITAGKAVQNHVPKDALIIAPYNGDTAFLYQTERRGWPVVDRPIDQMIGNGAEYFVSVDLNHPQTVKFTKDYQVIEKTEEYVILKLEGKK
jgi:hypothetical protein